MPQPPSTMDLLGIFYYRNPESRARRLAKAVAAMVDYAEKRAARTGTARKH